MSFNLQLVSCLFIFIVLILVVYMLRNGRINIKYALVWIAAITVLLLFLIFPSFFTWLTKLLGFNVGSNMIFAGLIAFLIFINIILTIIVSNQNNKIRLLIQEVSMLKGKVNAEK